MLDEGQRAPGRFMQMFSMRRRFAMGVYFFLAVSTMPQAAGGATDLSWKSLRGYNLKTGKISTLLQGLNGKVIQIPGFIVPLDDMSYESVGRFLLVPDPQACIHVPPPPANQMIYVVMKGGKKAPISTGMPVILTGDLKIKAIRSQFGTVSFQVSGESVKPFRGR